MGKIPEPAISSEYFKEHKCSLPKERMSHRISCGKLRRLMLNLSSVSVSDARARAMFRSYASLGAEKYRHYKFHPFTIHPYSKIRVTLEMLLVFLVIGEKVMYLHSTYDVLPEYDLDTCIVWARVSDGAFAIHVILNFFTGFVSGETQKYIVLDIKKITCHYLRTWFLLDCLMYLFRVVYLMRLLNLISEDVELPLSLLFCFSLIRILNSIRIYFYMKNTFEAKNIGINTKTILEIIFLIIVYLCQNFVYQFMLEYMTERDFFPKTPRSCSWMTLTQMWNKTATEKFAHGLEQSVRILRRSIDWYLVSEDTCIEPYLIVAWAIGQMIIFKCSFLYLLIMVGSDASKAKYFMKREELQAYMKKLKLPTGFQQRIYKFLSIKYNSHYYVESYLLQSVTGRLREDIILHTRWHLVQGVEFLKQLPRELQIQVALKLKVEIVAAGDVIYKINSVADSFLFIQKGTVTTYSLSGREICHYEDGDYFGITVIFGIRHSTAVAVTNCELFRLDKDDFDNTVGRYPDVLDHIKRTAKERRSNASVLDEQFRTQIKTRDNARSKGKLL